MNISGIILAAGASTRMGTTKQLLPFGSTTILGKVIEQTTASRLHEVIVVLGYDSDRIISSVDVSGTRIVQNAAYQDGQSTSLKKGIGAVSAACGAAMFLLGDQPFVTTTIINRLVETYCKSEAPLAIPYYNGKRGNPVIIARGLFHRLTHLTGDVGAKVLFEEYRASLLRVNLSDPAILRDIDTRDDYARLILGSKPSGVEMG